MATTQPIRIAPLKKRELEEAERIVRIAFGTFLGMANPIECMDDRNFMAPRFRSPHVKVIAAREGDRLIGSNVVTRWGSFAFFGPLTILPEYWDRGVAQRLLEPTMSIIDGWRVRHSGLFTFAHSPKHVGLYQKFGYWPRYLTAIMTRAPESGGQSKVGANDRYLLLSELTKAARERAITACRKLTGQIDKGLDLSDEIRAVVTQGVGDVVLVYSRDILDGFAVCHHGRGSEGGEKICYVKFGAARGGTGGGKRFDALLDACEAFALKRGTALEAGMNLAREDAYKRMRARGFRTTTQGIAMQRPHVAGFNRAGVYVVDDWR